MNAATYHQRLLAIPRPIRSAPFLLLGVLGFALGMYWWFTVTGLYRWLADGQGALFGYYLPIYTGIFTLIVTVVVTILVGSPLAGLLFFVIVKLNLFPFVPIAPVRVKLSRTDALPRDPREYGNEE